MMPTARTSHAAGSLLFMGLLSALAAAPCAVAADLTIADGVVVKFGADAELAVRDRVSVGNSVVFTSAQDDQIAGQTGPTPQSAAAGNWRGVRIEKSAAAFGTQQLRDIFIRYAGAQDEAALTLRGLSPPLQFVQLTDSALALRLEEGAAPAISGTSFTRNATAIDASSSAPTIANSVFELNSTQAILNRTPTTIIQASGNWWGHISGPRDPAGNPAGQGDLVSSGVNYASYLASAPLLNPTVRLAAPATYFETHSVQVELSCVNAVEYRVAEGSSFAGLAFQPLVGGRATVAFALSAGDGRKTVNAQFRNSSGVIVSAGLAGGVLVDSEPPALAINNPAPGSLITDSIIVEAAASDGAGVNRVLFYVDGQLRLTDTAAPYSYSWNNSGSPDGDYALRVVAIDEAGRSTERTNTVTLARAAAPPDVDGPALATIRFDGVAFATGATVARSGTISVSATDRSGVVRVELLLNGQVVSIGAGTGTYSLLFNIDNVANGAHTLALRAIDSLNNVATTSLDITVAHAPPDPPRLLDPAAAFTTRYAALTVSGSAQLGKTVQLIVNGQPAGDSQVVGADQRFSVGITLAAGANQIRATAQDQYGTSALSTALLVTLDTAVPASPANLVAQAQAAGKVRLVWTASSDPNAVGYFVYRAPAAFADIAEALRVNPSRISVTALEDLPPGDGTYFYRVVAVNNAGTPSDPSNQVQASSDATLPKATTITYAPRGSVDTATGRVGQGQVDVVLAVSEALQVPPYLAIVPQGGAPIPVDLTRASDTEYRGAFLIGPNTPSGASNALFSARDLVGNRGTTIDAGASLNIDTAGPEVSSIALTPSAPIRNDGATTITTTLSLSKPMKSGELPQLSYLLTGGPARSPIAISGFTQLNPTSWRASFLLPADAGESVPESLAFSFRGIDDLNNVATRIATTNRFQVYRGELPPADVPLGFVAKAQPGGKVRLSWLPVAEAALYQIYRQSISDTSLVELVRATGDTYIDQTPSDGAYLYAVASIRQSNGQETLSGQSATVEVLASSTAPGAPENLELILTGQGIRVTWQPPAASAVFSYNLYRASGTVITSIEGLTPLKTGITLPITVDANPSTTEHAYVVTALDSAGNESPISNSGYLNAALLPVATLSVEQQGNDLPVLTWTPSRSSSVAGYNVYVGPDSALTKLTPTPLNALTLTDTGYTSGERRYTVAAVDSNGVEMPRTVLLPHLSMELVSGTPLLRGVMNRVQVQVTNLSAQPSDSARVVVRAGGKDHRSEPFSIAANETKLVPVVVGGYPDLPAQAPLQVSVEASPNEGELVRIAKNTTADVGDSALVVGIATEQFTRGGVGKVRLTVENTSDVEVELLTARANGNQDSNELRFKILDGDGNVLATQSYRQVFGAGVVTLISGETVARIPAGAGYSSDAFELNVPSASPTSIRVRLEVDKLRYHSGQPTEVVIAGRGSERVVSLIDTAYAGEVTNVAPVSSFGDQDVVISGRALDRQTSAALPNSRLKLILNQEGFERVFNVLTDGAGAFEYVFKPTLTDAGTYRVSAVHPDITDRPEQRSFTINRVTVGPTPFRLDVPKNYPFTIPFTAKAGPGTSAGNLRLVLDPASQPTGQVPAGVTMQLPAPINIAERQTRNLGVVFTANNEAQPTGSVILDVMSDDHPLTPIGKVRVDYTLSEARPFLTSTPSVVETGLAQGGSQVESVIVQNKGLQAATDLQFTLQETDGRPAPSWVAIASSVNGTLNVGEQRSIDLSFTPPSTLAEGVYQFHLVVQGANVPAQTLNVFASVTQSGQGNAFFRASDIYTATVGSGGSLIPGLAGASISMQNEDVPTVTQELVTDTLGEALFQNLPAGRYKFRARAANHQELGGRVLIKPGITTTQSVFLEYNLITVEWSVREITIQDRYEITLNATFETDVPAAVVVMQPRSINLPKMNPGDVYYGELSLTNYGLIRADDVKQQLPRSDQFFRYEFLVDVPNALVAKQRVTIPYRIVALQSLDTQSGAASGGGCYSYSNSLFVTCKFECKNGFVSNCGSSASWFSFSNSSCPTGSTGVPAPGGGGWTGGGSGGWGGAGTSTPIRLRGKKCVYVPKGGESECE